MGAREDIFMELCGVHEGAEERANKLIDDLLHEAAEKIRSSPGWCEGEWMDSRDRDHAAKLIDPYVQ